MATIRKGSKGWQSLIRRKGYSGPISKTFATRKEAEIWARTTDEQLTPKRPDQPAVPLTVADAIEAFIDGPLQGHRSAANELYPLRASARSWLGSVLLSELTIRHLAIWRDQRLTAVKANTVMRELRVLRVLLDWARDERGANLSGNPTRKLKAKADKHARVAFLSQGNGAQLIKTLNRRKNPDNAFLVQLALTTAMRRSELLALRWEDIGLERRVARLHRKDCAATGQQQSHRLFPLSKATVQLLEEREGRAGRVACTTACSGRLALERSKRYADLEDLRFHDLRHAAIIRLWMDG